MRTLIPYTLAFIAAAPLANAYHDTSCVIESAYPFTYLLIQVPADSPLDEDRNEEWFYQEERDTGLPPVPMSGAAVGDGSWTYYETWALPGLQRGGFGLFGEWFPPDCSRTSPGDGQFPPCLIYDVDPIQDEDCGHGPDALIF